MLRGGTLFSGIGTPEVACPEIDWRWCAEIDPFACAVLKQRFPHVPNLGDVEKVNWDAVEPVDLIVFGSPCQSFSVAGKRLGLDDPRGNLALVALAVVARLRPRWFVFENVPGLLSSDGGRDFGIFLGSVGELGYGWAYRTLDAQHFGIPQRRRRLFVVGHSGGDWRLAAAVLFEPKSLSRDPPPSRETWERAPTLPSRSTAGGGLGTDAECDEALISTTLRARDLAKGVDSDATDTLIAKTLSAARGQACANAADLETYVPLAYGGNNRSGPIEVATALNGHPGPHGRLDFTVETFIAHALTAEGFDASEDGTGRGPPIIPIPLQNATRGKSQNGLGIGGEAMFTLDGASQHAVAFSAKDYGADASDVAPTLRAMEWDGSHANGGGQLAIAFRENTRAEVKFVEGDIAQSLTSGGGKPGQGFPAVMAVADPLSANEARTYTHEGSNNFRLRNCVPSPMSFTERTRADGRNLEAQEDLAYALCNPGSGGRTHSRQLLDSRMAVRRLTPTECSRLQGLPDDWTAITYRGKPAADGPRYRALGNAMAAPVVRWILKRIQGADA